ncbi:MAG TPA: PHB depolymerase family esterase [Chitinophagaceae bacterium]|jgi:polyhydroxybutyrate depolymerase|nr:PHB depolymerase family esterase [Chitinophagaceae bacterium]
MMNRCLLSGLAFLLVLAVSCRKKKLPDTELHFSGSMIVEGRERTYTVNLPPNYPEGSGFSLVLALHGGGGSARQFETTSGLSEKANASGFIVVYPEGVRSSGLLGLRTWNAGGCCDDAAEKNIDDVQFISRLIDQLVAGYKINPKRVYATGHSNGGMMAYRLACQLSHKMAAIAPSAATLVVQQSCQPGRSVPVLHLHSAVDRHVPFEGGVGSGPSKHYNPPVDSALHVFLRINGCPTIAVETKETSGYTHKKWSGCSGNAEVQYYLTKDGGHAWAGGSKGSSIGDAPSTAISSNDLLWAFFQQYQLP